MMAAAAPARLDVRLRHVLSDYLLGIADDEFLLGHRHAEWTGFGPDVESDVALSSIAQEEMGHAKLFYQQALVFAGGRESEVDALAFERRPEEFRNAVLVERPNGDWGFSIVRLCLYDLADEIRLNALARSPLEVVPDLARTLGREEKYHRMYGQVWLSRLAEATPESHGRIQQALDAVWPEARGLFEPVEGEVGLVEEGLLPEAAPAQASRWEERVRSLLQPLDLRPSAASPHLGGRRGQHTGDLTALLDELTSVRRLEPGATW